MAVRGASMCQAHVVGTLLALALLTGRAAAFVPDQSLLVSAARVVRGATQATSLCKVVAEMEQENFLSRRDIMGGAVAAGLGLGLQPRSGVAEPPSQGVVQLGRGVRALQVPEMGVGAWSWGDAATWGYTSEASIEQAYRACLENGITFIDTAEVYGTGARLCPSARFLCSLYVPTPGPLPAGVRESAHIYVYVYVYVYVCMYVCTHTCVCV